MTAAAAAAPGRGGGPGFHLVRAHDDGLRQRPFIRAASIPVDHAGDATFYDADGSELQLRSRPDLMIGAMNHADYAGSAACGACVHARRPRAARSR